MARSIADAEARKEQTRRDIIDAAFVCFADKGYHGTGIADIAAKLGIGHGTFYRHFKNKRDIIDHVVDQLIAQVLRALAVGQGVNPPGALPVTVDEYRAEALRVSDSLTRIFLADPRVPRMMLFEATSIDPELTAKVFEVHDAVVATMAANFAYGVKQGFLRADLDTANTARAVMGMMIANMLNGLRSGTATAMRELEAAVLALIFDGVVAR